MSLTVSYHQVIPFFKNSALAHLIETKLFNCGKYGTYLYRKLAFVCALSIKYRILQSAIIISACANASIVVVEFALANKESNGKIIF